MCIKRFCTKNRRFMKKQRRPFGRTILLQSKCWRRILIRRLTEQAVSWNLSNAPPPVIPGFWMLDIDIGRGQGIYAGLFVKAVTG